MRSNVSESPLDLVAKHYKMFPLSAYCFVYETLRKTLTELQRNDRPYTSDLSPNQLMEGFAQQALQSYGPYAAYVLKKWKMNTFKDLGTILLHLSEFEMVQLKDTEQFDHFNNDINLEKLLLKPFLIEAKKLKFSAPEFDCLRKNM